MNTKISQSFETDFPTEILKSPLDIMYYGLSSIKRLLVGG